MRKKLSFLYLYKIIMFISVLSVFSCFFVACNLEDRAEKKEDSVQKNEEQREKEQNKNGNAAPNPNSSSASYKYAGQENIYVLGDWLYYCDHDRSWALYAQNLKTGEEKLVAEEAGTPYQTAHGFFYVQGKMVYEIAGFELKPLCQLPEYGEFEDYVQGKVYWVARYRFTKNGFEYYSRQSLHVQEITSGIAETAEQAELAGRIEAAERTEAVNISAEASDTVYDISDGTDIIGDVLLLKDTIYIAQSGGLYVLQNGAAEAEHIFNEEIWALYSDGTSVVFRTENSPYDIYRVLPEGNMVQRLVEEINGTFVFLHEGCIYYNNGAIMSYHLEKESSRVLSDDTGKGNQAYIPAAVYENYLILRHGYGYTMYLFDMEKNVFENFAER